MNNIFDFSRFGKYFIYDLRNSKNNFGWSMLILALLPLFVFVVSELFCLTINGHVADMPDPIRYVAVYIGLLVTVLVAPVKIWGKITDKRYGSDWLMIPASAFEKWLSMMLICVLVLPLCISAMVLVGDAVCTFVFGDVYAVKTMLSELRGLKDLDFADGIDFDFFGLGYTTWLSNILIFTLGALCFKKAKAAKTILVCFAVATVCSLICTAIIGQVAFTSDDMEWLFRDLSPEQAITRLNVVINIVYFTIVAALVGACYFRIKTIKH